MNLRQKVLNFFWAEAGELEISFLNSFYQRKNLLGAPKEEKINGIKNYLNLSEEPSYKNPQEGLQKYERLFLIKNMKSFCF